MLVQKDATQPQEIPYGNGQLSVALPASWQNSLSNTPIANTQWSVDSIAATIADTLPLADGATGRDSYARCHTHCPQ